MRYRYHIVPVPVLCYRYRHLPDSELPVSPFTVPGTGTGGIASEIEDTVPVCEVLPIDVYRYPAYYRVWYRYRVLGCVEIHY